MLKSEVNICRVCGRDFGEPVWGEHGDCPTFFICPCCGVEFGYGDFTSEAIKNWRERWIRSGTKWRDEKDKPADWDLEKQLSQIPKQFR